jgi:putative addiction module killer protein
MEVQPKELARYITIEGKVPFDEWFESLRDPKTRSIIVKRLNRISLGNFGDCRSVGAGVYELRIDYSSGYRLYFGQVDLAIVLLLCGGDKSSQDRDIQKAKEYWLDYEERESTD